MARQMTFDLPAKPALGREDFFISPANALAVEMLENWPAWPSHKLALIGPKDAGKTHLVQVWAAETDATVVSARDLSNAELTALADHPIAIEDVREIAANLPAQEALFHLHNLAQENGSPLLVTADTAPNHWALSLPDLQSRMAATTVTTLSPPDDALLSAVLVKLFADRQIDVKPKLVTYLLKRMDRSFDAAGRLVAALDETALSEGRAITQSLAARVLDNPPPDTA